MYLPVEVVTFGSWRKLYIKDRCRKSLMTNMDNYFINTVLVAVFLLIPISLLTFLFPFTHFAGVAMLYSSDKSISDNSSI